MSNTAPMMYNAKPASKYQLVIIPTKLKLNLPSPSFKHNWPRLVSNVQHATIAIAHGFVAIVSLIGCSY